jgi:hypothetical protein
MQVSIIVYQQIELAFIARRSNLIASEERIGIKKGKRSSVNKGLFLETTQMQILEGLELGTLKG